MRVLPASLTVLALLLAGTTSSPAQDPIGDPVAGARLVKARCSACHAGDPDVSEPLMPAETFAEIANRRGTTAYRILAFLRTSHATMPNYILTSDEIDDISAYIMSLRRPRR